MAVATLVSVHSVGWADVAAIPGCRLRASLSHDAARPHAAGSHLRLPGGQLQATLACPQQRWPRHMPCASPLSFVALKIRTRLGRDAGYGSPPQPCYHHPGPQRATTLTEVNGRTRPERGDWHQDAALAATSIGRQTTDNLEMQNCHFSVAYLLKCAWRHTPYSCTQCTRPIVSDPHGSPACIPLVWPWNQYTPRRCPAGLLQGISIPPVLGFGYHNDSRLHGSGTSANCVRSYMLIT